jgi:putative ABC transport system permease protein
MSLQNIKRSIRDYAIYFFTLIIGISVFYVFNAVGGQAAMMRVSASSNDVVGLLKSMLSGVSVFVAVVLALLIVYASRFLMKRRNREFALYMMLGMGKRKISAILLMESLIVGAGSLVAGLLVGIAASQLMSALVASLFEADMTAYKFSISTDALILTVVCFVVMYFAVMLLNGVAVTRMKLIDLMNSSRKSEKISMRNPYLCVAIFIISAVLLGAAYYQVTVDFDSLNENRLMIAIVMGAVTTVLIFWSVSGLMLRILMSVKKAYFKGLNAFTFRQISSKINTMVLSMSVICLMLFITICTLSSAFTVRNSMNKNLKECCPADVQITYNYPDGEAKEPGENKIESLYNECGEKLTENIKEYTFLGIYRDSEFTYEDFLGVHKEEYEEEDAVVLFSGVESLVKLSEYNALRNIFGMKEIALESDEFAVICDYKVIMHYIDYILRDTDSLTIFGHELKPKYNNTIDGFVEIGSQPLNYGMIIVPDSIVDETGIVSMIFTGNYDATIKNEKIGIDEKITASYKKVQEYVSEKEDEGYCYLDTKNDIYGSTVGMTAIITFLGLYIGIVFLIASGAILALKELSDSVDSIPRYEMLRKIGAEEKTINKSLFCQTGIFFLLPLALAIIHSIFGMKFAVKVLEGFGTDGIGMSIAATSIILAIIYGGYLLVTYLNSKSIVNTKVLTDRV